MLQYSIHLEAQLEMRIFFIAIPENMRNLLDEEKKQELKGKKLIFFLPC